MVPVPARGQIRPTSDRPVTHRWLSPLDEAARVLVGLPRPMTRRVAITYDMQVPMRDEVTLTADHYMPAPDADGLPTLLVRTPYGRAGANRRVARMVATMGYHVVLQSCRGTAPGTGVFAPLVQERDDGLDTIGWLREQPWYTGRLYVYGFSYGGYAKWALADGAGTDLAALLMVATGAEFGSAIRTNGSFSLENVLTWLWGLDGVSAVTGGRRPARARLRAGLRHDHPASADRAVVGRQVGFFQDWLAEHDLTGDFWQRRDHTALVAGVQAPVHMLGGWYDPMLPAQLADHAALERAGARPRLTIGQWTHNSTAMFRRSIVEAMAWFASPGATGSDSPRVRLQIGGGGWRHYPQWPPPELRPEPWYLRPDGRLAAQPADVDAADRFSYDPADPTPSLGGPLLASKLSGSRDNRRLERRADVLTYTSDPLAAPVEYVGPVTATVYVRSALPHFDVFVRVCDVDRAGRSWNISDGLLRCGVEDTGRIHEVRLELWPMAHRFRAGHRIRIQVSAGAHPRFARNPGTGAGVGQPTELLRNRLAVFGGPNHPSSVRLPAGPRSAGS